MFDLENEGQIDGAQHQRWWNSMTYIKIYKRQYKIVR